MTAIPGSVAVRCPDMKVRADIDGLRGTAVAVPFQARIAPSGSGFVGGEIFSAISGYLIATACSITRLFTAIFNQPEPLDGLSVGHPVVRSVRRQDDS